MSCSPNGLKDVSDFFSGIFTSEETEAVMKPVLSPAIDTLQTATNVPKTVYTVQSGDTLAKIGKAHNIDYHEIAKANGINNDIVVGQELKIPNSDIPTVPKNTTPKPKSTKKPISDETSLGGNKDGCECKPPKWMKFAEVEAKKHIQRYQNQGKVGNNPEIMKYHNTTNIFKYDNRGERVSWCGTFINYVMKKAGYQTFSTAFRAKDWASIWGTKYGKKVSKPIYGAIGVKSRKGGGMLLL